MGRSVYRRDFDESRGVESVCVIWEEVSNGNIGTVNVLQSACEGGDGDVGCVGRGRVSSEKVDDNGTCSVELSFVVNELLTCERVGSNAM